jgi:hypothetical protein
MALPRSRSYLGIAKETRPAAGDAPTPVTATDFIPYTSITPFDNVAYLDDKGMRGSMVDEYDVIQGQIYSEFDVSGDVFADTVGYMVAGVLGDVVTTGATAPYTHTVSTLNAQAEGAQPTTYTLSDYYSLGASSTREYSGVQFASIDFKFSADALLTYAAKGMGYQSVTAANPAPSFSSVTPLPSWTGTVTLNGTSTAILADGNCNISRPVSPIFTVDGNQRPYQLFAGPVTAGGALTLVFESDTQLDYYLNNTQPSLEIAFTQGTGANAQAFVLSMTKCAFTVAKIERSKDYIELSVTYKALANTTDQGASLGYSPIKVYMENAKPSGTYAPV